MGLMTRSEGVDLAATMAQIFIKTKMHSSRMRTGRSLTVCRSLLSVSFGGGVSAPRGCLLPGGVVWYPSMH